MQISNRDNICICHKRVKSICSVPYICWGGGRGEFKRVIIDFIDTAPNASKPTHTHNHTNTHTNTHKHTHKIYDIKNENGWFRVLQS